MEGKSSKRKSKDDDGESKKKKKKKIKTELEWILNIYISYEWINCLLYYFLNFLWDYIIFCTYVFIT